VNLAWCSLVTDVGSTERVQEAASEFSIGNLQRFGMERLAKSKDCKKSLPKWRIALRRASRFRMVSSSMI
jgi:hypothetical protein